MNKLLLAAAALAISTGANATVFNEVENNDTFATANSIDGFFSQEADANIANSTVTPHVTIVASPEQGGRDTFSFTVTTANSLGIFDIDFGAIFEMQSESVRGFDANISIFSSAGDLLAFNDDASPTLGADGSSFGFDSYLEYTFATTGTYFVQIGSCCNNRPFDNLNGGLGGYQLQVSLENGISEVPEPAMLGLFGLGAIGLGLTRRRRA